jgi:hypothetical protein
VAGTYGVVKDLCAALELEALTEKFPKRLSPQRSKTESGFMTDLRCVVPLQSTSRDGGLVGVTASIGKDPDAAKALYEGLRGVETKQAPGGTVTDVPGVGQQAYTYVDEALGPRLVVLDGNLYLTMHWSKSGGSAAVPADIATRLAAVATATMMNLQA